MSKAARREKQELELAALETEFKAVLIAGLQTRSWGFLQSDRWRPNERRERLLSLLISIRESRADLGYAEDFKLGVRFEDYGKAHGPNDPGEPKRADAFLAELDEAQSAPLAIPSIAKRSRRTASMQCVRRSLDYGAAHLRSG